MDLIFSINWIINIDWIHGTLQNSVEGTIKWKWKSRSLKYTYRYISYTYVYTHINTNTLRQIHTNSGKNKNASVINNEEQAANICKFKSAYLFVEHRKTKPPLTHHDLGLESQQRQNLKARVKHFLLKFICIHGSQGMAQTQCLTIG